MTALLTLAYILVGFAIQTVMVKRKLGPFEYRADVGDFVLGTITWPIWAIFGMLYGPHRLLKNYVEYISNIDRSK